MLLAAGTGNANAPVAVQAGRSGLGRSPPSEPETCPHHVRRGAKALAVAGLARELTRLKIRATGNGVGSDVGSLFLFTNVAVTLGNDCIFDASREIPCSDLS